MTERFVVDSSVAVNWMLDQPLSAAARSFLAERPEMVAPAWMRLELANALWKAFMSGLITRDVARLLHSGFDLAPIEFVDDPRLGRSTLALAGSLRHPVSDCCYIALSVAEGARLVTADRGLMELVNSHVIDGQAVWLGEWA